MDKNINLYNNYDLLTTINLLSNRSFKDIYQYPIFPILYSLINLGRDLGEHLGLQKLNVESAKRKEIIEELYILKKIEPIDYNQK